MSKIPDKVLQHANQKDISDLNKNRYLSAWEDKRSFRKAINAKCVECMGFEDVVRRIKECNIIICPLHHLRPFQIDN